MLDHRRPADRQLAPRASSPSPRPARASVPSSRQRVGSASAAKTAGSGSATAALIAPPGPARVVGQLAELARPAVGVGGERGGSLVGVDVERVEAALDDRDARAVALGGERELDQRRVAPASAPRATPSRQPAVGEAVRRLDRLDAAVERAVVAPAQRQRAAGAQVDLGAGVAEPAAEVVGAGDQLPHALDGRGDQDVSLDAVGLGCHVGRSIGRCVTRRLHDNRLRSNQRVTSRRAMHPAPRRPRARAPPHRAWSGS